MTTIATRRAELTAALIAGGVSCTDTPGDAQPPYAILVQAGSDLDGIGRGQVAFGWRVTLVAGDYLVATSATALDSLMSTSTTVLRLMDGWRLTSMSAASIRDLAGGLYLTADVTASAMIDL